MAARIILLRHGQTPANLLSELDTELPGKPLTELGCQQAIDVGSHQLYEIVGASTGSVGTLVGVYSSQALRARQTAELAVRSLLRRAKLPEDTIAPVAIAGIKEIAAGIYEDRSDPEAYHNYVAAYQAMLHGDMDHCVPGGENATAINRRFTRAILQVLDQHLVSTAPEGKRLTGDGDILFVAHGAVIRLMTTRLAQLNPQYAIDNYLDNCGIAVLNVTPDLEYPWPLSYWGRQWVHADGTPIAP